MTSGSTGGGSDTTAAALQTGHLLAPVVSHYLVGKDEKKQKSISHLPTEKKNLQNVDEFIRIHTLSMHSW